MQYYIIEGVHFYAASKAEAIAQNEERKKPKIPSDDSIIDGKRITIKYIAQTHIDAVAVANEFDSAVSLTGYAGFVNKWQPLAIKFSQWRANCWIALDDEQAKTPLTTATEITESKVLAILPVWTDA